MEALFAQAWQFQHALLAMLQTLFYTDFMVQTPSLIASEFATAEEAEAYDRWLCAKVQASLADARPTIAHDQVMAEMDAIIDLAEQDQSKRV